MESPLHEHLSTVVVPLLVTLPIMAVIVVPLSVCAGITTGLASLILLYRAVAAYVAATCSAARDCFARIIPGLGLVVELTSWGLWPRYAESEPPTSQHQQYQQHQHQQHQQHQHQRRRTLQTERDAVLFSPTRPRHTSTLQTQTQPPTPASPPDVIELATTTTLEQMTPRNPPAYEDRRLSTASIASAANSADAHDAAMYSLASDVDFDRDFEGLGGWRLGDAGNESDDAKWDALHSRLELPAYRHPHSRAHSLHRYPSVTMLGTARAAATRPGSGGAGAGTGAATPTEMTTPDLDIGSWSDRGRLVLRTSAAPWVATSVSRPRPFSRSSQYGSSQRSSQHQSVSLAPSNQDWAAMTPVDALSRGAPV